MRNFTYITSFIILVATAFVTVNHFMPTPCVNPITYKIGTFDTHFGISKTDFLHAAQTASQVWSKPAERELFAYDEQGALTIDLVYDERQKITQQNQELKADIAKTAELAGNIKEQYQTLEKNLAEEKASYNQAVEQFDARQKAYATDVEYWNSQGGAPQNEYQKLVATRDGLTRMQVSLEARRVALNAKVDEVNAFIQKYNLLVRDANTQISTVNQTAGKEFQEGTYDPNTNTITIYEFSTKEKLLRILAHEFGHALGLNHNPNPLSIMYELNQANTLTPSKDDIQELQTLCSKS